MTFFRFAPLSRPLASTCIKCFALLAIVFVETDIVRAIDISIGAPQVIYTKKQRSSGGGKSWPDGNLGVVSNGDGTYDFYAANSSKPVMTTGTLTNPGGSKQKVSIVDIPKKAFDYVAGGPVYADPYSGARLMVYHAEVQGKSSKNFYSVLGLALSTDPSGQTFHDLGTIITPNSPGNGTDVGGGSFAIVNGYFNVYYKDWLPNGHTSEVAVARAPLLDLLNNSLAGRSTSFTKYYNGGWTQPGLGGLSSHLELPNTANAWLGVSYNDYLGQLVMVGSQWTADGGDLYMTTSSDGVNWAPRQPVAVDPGEQFYPTIIGTGADPMHSGQSFYVYYTDSQKGAWSRWKDAELRRREITINSPSGIGSLSSSPTLTADWVELGGYQSDFQGGAPAMGWTYAWDPKGKVGKSSAYVPLLWSESEQAYNTTGSATPVPDKKSHHDDYLSLTADGGHPGNKKYMPMAGYTIQAEDGAGFYRIADSSIQKDNDTLMSKEDGLGVLVYVNDTLIGSEQGVLTDGLLTGFDRTLGTLNVGDTVWVMIDPIKSQIDDAFTGFDFSLQKLVYSMQNLALNAQMPAVSVPEPGTMGLLIVTLAAGCFPRRRRRTER